MAQFFFAIPGHNAHVERVFSLINAQWTKERNRFTVESIRGLTLVQFNYKNVMCTEFYKYLLQNKDILKQIGSSEKYGTCTPASATS